MSVTQRLDDLSITLPQVVAPLAAYVPVTQSGQQLYTAGQIPVRDGSLIAAGQVGGEVPVDIAIECARLCAINALAAAQSALGDLRRVRKVVKLTAFVAADPHFVDFPTVGDGASRLLLEVFGASAGRHVRTAVGVSRLPLNAPVEIDFQFEVE
ncbi:RidA family protein [Rhodococcus opacus]|nr:RidA family protein [Rhodococcus opacus]